MTLTISKDLLLAALDGLERKKGELEANIAELRGRLTGGAAGDPSQAGSDAPVKRRGRPPGSGYRHLFERPAETPVKKKRHLSKAGRAAISAATRKRWAEFHKAKRAAA